MRTVTTYTGRTLEFLELETRTLHLRPRQTLELSEEELDQVRDEYPEVFARMFVHAFTDNQKSKMKHHNKVDIEKVSVKEVKKLGRPGKDSKSTKDSDSDKP